MTTLTIGVLLLGLLTAITLHVAASQMLRIQNELDHTHAVAHATLAALELHLQGKDVQILHLPPRNTPRRAIKTVLSPVANSHALP